MCLSDFIKKNKKFLIIVVVLIILYFLIRKQPEKLTNISLEPDYEINVIGPDSKIQDVGPSKPIQTIKTIGLESQIQNVGPSKPIQTIKSKPTKSKPTNIGQPTVLNNAILNNPNITGTILNPVNMSDAIITTLRITPTFDNKGNITKSGSLRLGDNIIIDDTQGLINFKKHSHIDFQDSSSYIKIGDQLLNRDILAYLNNMYKQNQKNYV